MADFGDFSDTTDDSEVEELLSKAQDLCVLEQVSKINCSSFTDSLLPPDLETRFRKLKSFPVTKTTVTFYDSASNQNSVSTPKNDDSLCGKLKDRSFCDEESKYKGFDSKKGLQTSKEESLKSKSELIRDNDQNPDGIFIFEKGTKEVSAFSTFIPSKFSSGDDDHRKHFNKESRKGSVSPFSDSSTSWNEALSLSPSKQKGNKKGVFKSNSGSFSSVSGSEFPSPPQRSCFFWCLPEKVSRKKSKENWNFDRGMKDYDEFLSNLNSYSVKEQQKIVKKAMKEEAKVSREAEKIVKWGKQVSGRMSSHSGEDDPSDDDLTK